MGNTNDRMIEQWRDIPGYKGLYQISNTGKVKSLTRKVKSRKFRTVHEKDMILEVTINGYLRITLRKEGKYKRFMVHRLLMENFVHNPDNLPQVNHINGIKTDNRLENLEWISVSDNIKHAYRTGLKKGTAKKKYSDVMIQEIRELAQSMSYAEIARRFGMDRNYPRQIVIGRRRWNVV